MRQLIALGLVAVTASGACASGNTGVFFPTGAAAAQIHDWEAVLGLSVGTHVLVAVDPDGIIDGRVVRVDARQLEISASRNAMVVERASVARVVEVSNMAGIRAKQGAVAGLVLLGFMVVLTSGLDLVPIAAIDTGLFAGLGAATGSVEPRQVVIYERR